jgi:hypothetical protein
MLPPATGRFWLPPLRLAPLAFTPGTKIEVPIEVSNTNRKTCVKPGLPRGPRVVTLETISR